MGGPARFFVEAPDEEAAALALRWARERNIPVFMLGGGSNLLIADQGIDALVLRICAQGFACEDQSDRVRVRVAAGEPWDAVVARAVAQDLAGIECLSGIPGDTGAAPIQNIGAYGQDVSETIERVRAIDRNRGEIVEFRGEECQFGYRDSVFKRSARDLYAITQVTFALRKHGPPSLRYAELVKAWESSADAGSQQKPTLSGVRDLVIKLRRGKSMVFDRSDENHRSAGSFFMNPLLSPDEFERAALKINASGVLGQGEQIPQFAADRGAVKIPAAWLIERAGFKKGTCLGSVALSTRHALAVVNRGGASAREIIEFAGRIRAEVFQRFSVVLEPEPVLAGFDPMETEALTSPLKTM